MDKTVDTVDSAYPLYFQKRTRRLMRTLFLGASLAFLFVATHKSIIVFTPDGAFVVILPEDRSLATWEEEREAPNVEWFVVVVPSIECLRQQASGALTV